VADEFSRRSLLKTVGGMGAANLVAAGALSQNQPANDQSDLKRMLAEPSRTLLEEHEDHQYELNAGDMAVSFDKRYGSISSIRRKSDELQTNYIGNERNTPGVDVTDSLWTGDVVATVWRLVLDWKSTKLGQNDIFQSSGKWARETTGKSADTRRIGIRNSAFVVEYDGGSMNDNGVRSYRLTMTFRAGTGSSLLWDIELENATNNVLEIGELGLPLMVNDDYAELYVQPGLPQAISTVNNVDFNRTPVRQKLIHEQKVLVHHFVAGHSSYALIQRPLGDAPFLLVHPTMDTSFECVYKEPNSAFAAHVNSWRGPDILAIHSWATKNLRRWNKNPWVNGHTSLVLQPGEKKAYQVRFAFIDGYEAIRKEICDAGNLGIRVVPSMVVQENDDVLVELNCKSDINKINLLSDNITVKRQTRENEKTLLTLSFKGRGQKSLKLLYGNDRWTNLHFYCINDIEQLLKARGQFIVEREFYQNPEDPYHRNHMFLPFDYRIGSTFLDSDEVWEVGGSDESGFSEPLFLAEKNVYYPHAKEVETLETYVTDCLFKYIQNPETYAVRASLYYKERYPSSPWGHWTKERSEATFRTYNYVHPALIYYALYRIGKNYGLVKRKTPEEYLRMSYLTCMKWFTTGPWRHVGLMEGSHSVQILEAIKSEGWQQEYNNLRQQMKECDEVFVEDPYPYSSELLIDQTAHEQVYFFTRFFDDAAKNTKTVQVLKALRGGNQPVWFRYGNDKRGDVCCWYNASLNGMALLKSFESSGDLDALLKGYAGVMSVMANVLPDGMGFNFFICTPGIYGHEPPRTFESGPGLWGFLNSAKSYVVNDPTFGLVGYGCRVAASGSRITVDPKDGVKKRVRFVDQKLDIEVTQGEINQVTLGRNSEVVEMTVRDSTGVVHTASIAIEGLPDGNYKLMDGKTSRVLRSTPRLAFSLPMPDARHIRIEKI